MPEAERRVISSTTPTVIDKSKYPHLTSILSKKRTEPRKEVIFDFLYKNLKPLLHISLLIYFSVCMLKTNFFVNRCNKKDEENLKREMLHQRGAK